MNQMFNLFSQIMSNPMAALRQKYDNIPENITDWQEAVKYLANNGTIKQNQINQAKQMYNNPIWQMIAKMFMK